jgi:hypothetical protein
MIRHGKHIESGDIRTHSIALIALSFHDRYPRDQKVFFGSMALLHMGNGGSTDASVASNSQKALMAWQWKRTEGLSRAAIRALVQRT